MKIEISTSRIFYYKEDKKDIEKYRKLGFKLKHHPAGEYHPPADYTPEYWRIQEKSLEREIANLPALISLLKQIDENVEVELYDNVLYLTILDDYCPKG